MFRFGLIVNPYAGIGGAVGLKGSDGSATVQEALVRGAERKAQQRVMQALEKLIKYKELFQFITVQGEMGSDVLAALDIPFSLLNLNIPLTNTDSSHTKLAAQYLLDAKVDLLIFAGGDGTARDICSVVEEAIPVLGIPAGVKIHSSVYGISPKASGEVICALLEGKLVDIRTAEIRDLDEDAFRNNQVRAKYYGDMRVPQLGYFVQSVKQGGVESEELVLADIAGELHNQMQPDVLYLMGSGKTTEAIMKQLGFPNTLLGVDAVYNNVLVGNDLTEAQILKLLTEYDTAQAIVSVMGGQGHIFGRGNQQFSSRVLKILGKKNIKVVSTKRKITELNGRPLVIDSGDSDLDSAWAGSIEIITGYKDSIVYRLV